MLRLEAPLILLLGLAASVLSSEDVMTELRVNSRIEQRYAQTTVTSTMKNTSPQSKELKFKMTLPPTAFISSLIMEIGGKNYTSTVKGKEAAKRTYDRAKQRGKTTGLVEKKDDSKQKFEVSANVAGYGKVTFYLGYEELLRREKGKYLYTVDVQPGYVVPTVSIYVTISENEPLKDVEVTAIPQTYKNEILTVVGSVTRSQTHDRQVDLSYQYVDSGESAGSGLEGVFSVTYDVERLPDAGEVQVVGNYFVHHFSPEGLPKMPVHTVFVLDVSYSMSDGKLSQLKEAMVAILQDLKPEDTFELIAFASDVKHLGTFSGKKKELKAALKTVKKLKVTGSTNLHAAYQTSVQSIMAFNKTKVARQIVFLTDGVATTGERNKRIIRNSVRVANSERHPIFGLAFGGDADFKLLKEISADNRAFARRIAFNEDTQDQLKGFYEEISTPLMAEVNIDYNEYEVDSNSVVKQGTSNFYSGGEVVSAGHIIEGVTDIQPVVRGIGKYGPLQFKVQRFGTRPADSTVEKENFVARLWAYLMVQDLLEQASVTEDSTEVQNLKAKALQIALRFNFVTKLTSLVVVRPEDDTPDLDYETSADSDSDKPLQVQQSSASVPKTSRARAAGKSSRASSSISGRISSAPRGYVDSDPHFVVFAPDVPLPFCFDLHAQHGAILRLIRDPASGITVNGQVTSSKGKPHLTYFTRLYISFGETVLIVTPDVIHVRCPQKSAEHLSLWPFYDIYGNKIKSGHKIKANKKRNRTKRSTTTCDQTVTWKKAAGTRYGDVMMVMKRRKKLYITLRDGDVNFVVVRSKNKYDQYFLGFYLQDEQILSSNTTGIIGQFLEKNVTLTMPDMDGGNATISTSSKDEISVSVQRLNLHKEYELSEVSGYLGQRRSFLNNVHVRCIHVRNGGRGLLNGKPRDYIIPCFSC